VTPAERAKPDKPEQPDKPDKQARRRGDILGISALAAALLSGLAGDKLSQSIDSSGWIKVTGVSLTILLALIWAIYNAPVGLRRYRRWRSRTPREPSELHAAAEEAEQWLVSLGSDAGGLAASEWFQQEEPRLRELLAAEKAHGDNADDIARICDALEAWYLRRQAARSLLELSELLAAVADASGRRELTELAAARAATAYRLMGDLETASTRLGISSNVATHGRTAASLTTRRQVERALLHLARAEQAPAGNDRDEAVLNARDRLDDARLRRPGPDLAGEIAIQINLAIVHLYQQDPESALDQLRAAAARASVAGDASAHAHALELHGVAAWMQRSPKEAKRWWQQAEHLYAEVDEREGRARCLQHLGSAEIVAKLPDNARVFLEQSAELRGGEAGHPILTHYLKAARDSVDLPPPPADPPHRSAATWLRRNLTRLLR
jgi:tetratricopeptide (TPR) repeat protein